MRTPSKADLADQFSFARPVFDADWLDGGRLIRDMAHALAEGKGRLPG